MNVKAFLENIDEVISDLSSPSTKEAFEKNMGDAQDISFSEWVMIYFAWNELDSVDSIKRYYWHLEEEDEQKTK